MSKKPLLETNKTEPVLLEKKLKKLTGERYYFDRRLYEDELGFFNYNQEVTALRKVLDEKEVGKKLYLSVSKNGNVQLEIDTTVTIRSMEIKDQTSTTLPLEIAEALDIAKVAMFTALYENNDEFGNKIDFDEYLETAINFSEHKNEEYLDDFTSNPFFDSFNLKDWYKLYCEQVEQIYVEEFAWLIWMANDDPDSHELNSFYRNFKTNPNPFTKKIYKKNGIYNIHDEKNIIYEQKEYLDLKEKKPNSIK